MRAFLAVELPPSIRSSLARVIRAFTATRADVKWVDEPNLHITLKFLGEITDAKRQDVERAVAAIAPRHQPVRLVLAGLGAFPSVRSARVIWAGAQEGGEPLATLAADVEEGLAALGFPKEDRAFTAHVTLGRVRSPKNRAQLAQALARTMWRGAEPVDVTHVTLFQSLLSSGGPVYAPLARVALGGGPSPARSAMPGA